MGMWVTCIVLTPLGGAIFSMFMVQLLTGFPPSCLPQHWHQLSGFGLRSLITFASIQ